MIDTYRRILTPDGREESLGCTTANLYGEEGATFDFCNAALRLSRGFEEHGFARGTRILTLLKNNPFWVITDMALQIAGLVHVACDPSTGQSTLKHIIRKTRPAAALCEWKHQAGMLSKLPIFEGKEKDIFFKLPEKNLSFVSLCQKHWIESEEEIDTPAFPVNDRHELLSVYFTSGSTGSPRGIRHTSATTSAAVENLLPFYQPLLCGRAMITLPLAYSFSRISLYLFQALGMEICFADLGSSFTAQMEFYKPDVLIGVPQMFDSLALHLKNMPQQDSLKPMTLICSGAAVSEETADFLAGAGHTFIYQYGTSETFVVSASRHVRGATLSCGHPLGNVVVKISPCNEVVVGSSSLFCGYEGDKLSGNGSPKQRAFYRTGDLGHLDNSGRLHISGRRADSFKLFTGKFFDPAPLERFFSKNSGVRYCVAAPGGKGKIVIIIDAADQAKARPGFAEEMQRLASACNRQLGLSGAEAISEVIISDTSWCAESGELSGNLKVRRKFVVKKHLSE